MFGVDPLRFADVGLSGNHVVPPEIATGDHRAGTARAFEHDHRLDRLAAAQRNPFINRRLERQLLAAATLLVGGNHGNGTGIVDAVTHRLCRETTEHHRVNGADTSTGLHGDDPLDTHGHVDDDAITLLDAFRAQTIGQLINLGQQFLVGHLPDFAVIGFRNDCEFVAQARFNVTVQTVVRGVQLAVGKPLEERRIRFIKHLRERLLPAYMLACQTRPVPGVIVGCFSTQCVVSVHAGNRCLLDELGRRLKKRNGFILGHCASPVLCSKEACLIDAAAHRNQPKQTEFKIDNSQPGVSKRQKNSGIGLFTRIAAD